MATDPLANMPPAIHAQMREMFLDEGATLVDQLEKALLALEHAPDEAETILMTPSARRTPSKAQRPGSV